MNKTVFPNGKKVSRNDIKTGINNNICVCGTSGTGKTRNVIIPNLLEMSGSYIVTDPKGFLYKKYAKHFKDNGYVVKNLSFVHPERSCHYNPLDFCETTQDIQTLAYSFVYSDRNVYSSKDPYWDEQALFLINSVFSYLLEAEKKGLPEEPPTILNAIEYIRKAGQKSMYPRRGGLLTEGFLKQNMYIYEALIDSYKEQYGAAFCTRQYDNVLSAPEKTYSTIITSALSKFSSVETDELAIMLGDNEVDIDEIINKKTIYFVEISDIDNSMNLLVNVFFTQIMSLICKYADEKCENGRLPNDVIFIMDDFPSYKINNFDNIVNNIRSRGVSVIITVQTLKQLDNIYDNGESIISNCDTMIFMGTNDINTASELSFKINVPQNRLLNMPINSHYIIRRGGECEFSENIESEDLIAEYLG